MDVLYGLTKDFVFKEAVAFLKGKRTLTSEEYKMLSDESRAKAFTVSGYTSLEVLQEFLDCLTKAAEEGTTKEQFREDMNRLDMRASTLGSVTTSSGLTCRPPSMQDTIRA